jgi:hypothetical protein
MALVKLPPLERMGGEGDAKSDEACAVQVKYIYIYTLDF